MSSGNGAVLPSCRYVWRTVEVTASLKPSKQKEYVCFDTFTGRVWRAIFEPVYADEWLYLDGIGWRLFVKWLYDKRVMWNLEKGWSSVFLKYSDISALYDSFWSVRW